MVVEQAKRPEYKEVKDYIRKLLVEANDPKKSGSSPIVLFDGIRREVILNTIDKEYKEGRKIYNIPYKTKENLANFYNAWVDVFLGCLNYYEQKIKKDGCTFIKNENVVMINGVQYNCDNVYDYITKLEEISKENDLIKKGVRPVRISQSSIKINSYDAKPSTLQSEVLKEAYKKSGKPAKEELEKPKVDLIEEPIAEESKVSLSPKKPDTLKVRESAITIDAPTVKENKIKGAKLTDTYPKGRYPISKNTLDYIYDENDMAYSEPKVVPLEEVVQNQSENVIKSTNYVEPEPIESQVDTVNIKQAKTEEMTKRPRRVKVNRTKLRKMKTERVVYQKLNDDEILSSVECEGLSKKPLVFVPTDLSSKTENFSDNNYLLYENVPNVPRGAFISGKTITLEKVPKEALKIIKLCNKVINSGVICYEVNNNKLRKLKGEQLLEAFKAIEQLCTVLASENYYPLICTDLDVRNRVIETVLQLEPDHKLNYPLLTRISSRQLDDIDDSMDVVVMDPMYENDQVIVTETTAKYINYAINESIKTKTSSKVAA